MPQILQLILITYLVIINIIAIIITISDKKRAKKNKWRISENSLLIISALGGSVSMYITMKKIHHKTKKKKFMIGIPAIFVAQIVIVILVVRFILPLYGL